MLSLSLRSGQTIKIWNISIPGVRMGKANGLSKRPDLKVGVENDNENQKLIKKSGLEK